MKIISSKFFLLFSVLFGISFLGYLWFQGSLLSEAQVVPQSVIYHHQGEQMTLTRILAADRTADTGNKACAKLTGSNGQPMVCRNSVESFPYLGDKGCKQFYPGFAEFTSTYPGHGAHGGNYDIICLANSPVGDGGTCSDMAVNTCTTCPQCAKNLDCNESLAAPSNFADGAIVRCFDGPDVPAPVVEETAPTVSSAPSVVQSLPPVVDSTEVDGVFLAEVKGSDTGKSACAKFNKVCVGPSTFNRETCLDFYPHAATKNATTGPQSEHFCKAGSTTGVCAGTSADTCVMAVSSSQQVTCDSLATNVDSFFVECEDPYAPEVLEQIGGTLPPLSPPVARNDGLGYVDYTVTIHHPQQSPTQVQVEYSTDGGQTYHQATIISAEPSEGTVDVNNNASYQIGSGDAVDTDTYDSIVLDFVWDAGADEVVEGEFVLRVTVQDNNQNTTTDVSEPGVIEATVSHGAAEGSEETSSTTGSSDGNAVSQGETAEESSASGRNRIEDMQNCLESSDNGETPCGTDEEILEYLDALINDVIKDGDLSEKERAKAEFIKRYLALQKDGQTLEQMLQLFDHGMTRAEAVEIIVFLLSSHGVIFENGGLPLEYSDVSREHPYGQAIAYATAYGIVEGYPDETFRPDQAPNVAEMARIVVRAGALVRNSIQDAYSREVLRNSNEDWFFPYVHTLRSFGLSLTFGYEALGKTVSGLRFLDVLYDLLLASGVEQPFQSPFN